VPAKERPVADEKTYSAAELEAAVDERLAASKAENDKAFKNLWDEAKRAKAALKSYDGIDPEQHKALVAAAAEADRKKAASEGDFKQLEQQLVKKYEGELDKERKEKTQFQSAMEQYLIDSAALAELAKVTDSPNLLLPHVKSKMRVIQVEGGAFAARVVDEAGNIRIGRGAGATPMTMPEWIEELRQNKEFAPAFRGTGSSGGGASKSSAGGGGGSLKVIASTLSKDFLDNLDAMAKGQASVSPGAAP
jgi:hypothetical protein